MPVSEKSFLTAQLGSVTWWCAVNASRELMERIRNLVKKASYDCYRYYGYQQPLYNSCMESQYRYIADLLKLTPEQVKEIHRKQVLSEPDP